MHQSKERTLVLIKPDGIQRSLIGEIIQRFERSGLKLAGMKFMVPDKELVEDHYLVDPDWKEKTGAKTIASYEEKDEEPPANDPVAVGERVLAGLKDYMSAGPVVVMCWEGAHAVKLVRKLVGGTEPLESDVGTIRGDYVLDSYEMSDTDGRAVRNLVHASGDKEEAQKELDLWFADDELIDYSIVHEKILYDVNLDGILE
jgi:nucleoside-diphosphate kinase